MKITLLTSRTCHYADVEQGMNALGFNLRQMLTAE